MWINQKEQNMEWWTIEDVNNLIAILIILYYFTKLIIS